MDLASRIAELVKYAEQRYGALGDDYYSAELNFRLVVDTNQPLKFVVEAANELLWRLHAVVGADKCVLKEMMYVINLRYVTKEELAMRSDSAYLTASREAAEQA